MFVVSIHNNPIISQLNAPLNHLSPRRTTLTDAKHKMEAQKVPKKIRRSTSGSRFAFYFTYFSYNFFVIIILLYFSRARPGFTLPYS